MTNYDRIKAMSVEEMSEIIMCPAEMDCCFTPPTNCAKYSNATETDCDCCKCCKGKYKTTGGYHWEYAYDNLVKEMVGEDNECGFNRC